MPLTREQKQQIEMVRETFKRSLKGFCYAGLKMRDWSKPLHDDLEVFLKQPSKRKLILLPRGHLKSSIITKGWALQQVLNNFNLRILIANAVWDNAKRFVQSLEKYMLHFALEQYWGWFQSDKWNDEECTVRQRSAVLDAPTFSSSGVDKELTSQHFDIIIADDLVARKNSQTPEMRRKVKEFYRDLENLLEPEGIIVVVGTCWHQDDLYADLIASKEWGVFRRTCWASPGIPVFPQKFSVERLEALRRKLGAYEFSSQYLLSPMDEEAADFKKSQVRYYDPSEIFNPDGTLKKKFSLYMTVDPARELSRDADPSGILVSAMDDSGRIYCLDRLCQKLIPSDLVMAIFEMVQKWRLQRIGIETFAYQKTLKYMVQEEQRKRRVYFTVDELTKTRSASGDEHIMSKNARIRRLQPYFEQGLIWLRPDMQDFEDEILAFPRGKHDDLLDCLAFSIDYLERAPKLAPQKIVSPWSYGALLKAAQARRGSALIDKVFADLKAPVMPFEGWSASR